MISFTSRLPAAGARRRELGESDTELLFADSPQRRKAVTRARNALNVYQKGRCFYCFGPIGVIAGRADLGEVDHFFPHALKGTGIAEPVDGVWNLVLARSNWFLNRTYHPVRLMLNASWQARLEGRPIF